MDKNKRLITLMSRGFDTKLAKKAVSKNYTYSKLKVASKPDLKEDFDDNEVQQIIDRTRRPPISQETVEQLILECDWKCCICWDMTKEWPIIIHHIEDHSKTRNDSYENLVVLCLHHHGIAHSSWEINRHPLPKELIRQRKSEFVQALKDFKAGLRSAPGQENSINQPFGHSDIETLKHFSLILDRPAIQTPLLIEGNMNDFLKAIEDVISGFNTGILKTRDGREICRTKPRNLLSNPNWNEKMQLVTNRLQEIRSRIKVAVLDKEMSLQSDGSFSFDNHNIPEEVDAIRGSIIILFNSLLKEAKINQLSTSSLTRGRHL